MTTTTTSRRAEFFDSCQIVSAIPAVHFLTIIWFLAFFSEAAAAVAMSSTPAGRVIGTSGGDIVVVGLNSALQKRFILPEQTTLVPGNVHRANRIETGVGGKGQDVAITLSCLQQHCVGTADADKNHAPGKIQIQIQLCQFVGRDDAAGKALYERLADRIGSTSVHDLTIRTDSPTRTCTSIVARDETTELVEPSGEISPLELHGMLERIDEFYSGHRPKRSVQGLCLMGSIPPGVPSETYARILKKIFRSNRNSVCVVDSVVGIPELFDATDEMANKMNAGNIDDAYYPKVVFKVNASEFCKITNTRKTKSETGGVHLEELKEAISAFTKMYPATGNLSGLAITDGKHSGYFVDVHLGGSYSLFALPIPKLDDIKTLYPIGAGDATAGGLVAAWTTLESFGSDFRPILRQSTVDILLGLHEKVDKNVVVTAFAFGLCCGSASCLQEENSFVDINDVDNLLRHFGEIKCMGIFNNRDEPS